MSQAVVALPRLIELRSQYNKKLLGCVKEGEAKGCVQFSVENVGSADAKFEVQISKTGNGLVNIRSCYNNKYLQLRADSLWIAAVAEKPEEDQSKRSCTLLRPTSVDGDPNKIRLTSVYDEKYLCLWRAAQPYYACVYAGLSDPSGPDEVHCDVFDVIDWQSLVILPKYVVFKGDNDKFLCCLWYPDQNYLQFSQTNVEDKPMPVGNEIVQTSDGNICLRNMYWNQYWKLSPSANWIWVDSKVNMSNADTLFEPVKCSSCDDTIALRSVANKLFCKRLTTKGIESCLNAGSPSIVSETKLKVSEFVKSRKIENINFRLMDARIYGDEYVTELVSSSITNQGSANEEHTFELSYTDKMSSTWNNNISIKPSVEASFTARIPLIVEGDVTLGSDISGEFMWGETMVVEQKISGTYKVPIPPNTKVTVRITATSGTCDVPFSYTQHDVLYTGETVTTEMDDGVYTGINSYSYYTEVKEEPLTIDPNIASAGFKKVAKVSPSGVITPL